MITASGSAWLVVTSAPSVNSERPTLPLIGAGTVVNFRLIRAVSSAARFWSTDARAARAAAAASV